MTLQELYKDIYAMSEAAKAEYDDLPDYYYEDRAYFRGIMWAARHVLSSVAFMSVDEEELKEEVNDSINKDN